MLPKKRTENTAGPAGSADPPCPSASPPPPLLSSSLGPSFRCQTMDTRALVQVPEDSKFQGEGTLEASPGDIPWSLWMRNQRPPRQSSCLSSSKKPKFTWLQLPGPQCSVHPLPSISARPQLNAAAGNYCRVPRSHPSEFSVSLLPPRRRSSCHLSDLEDKYSLLCRKAGMEGGGFISPWKHGN